jgi:hypothetical protein
MGRTMRWVTIDGGMLVDGAHMKSALLVALVQKRACACLFLVTR